MSEGTSYTDIYNQAVDNEQPLEKDPAQPSSPQSKTKQAFHQTAASKKPDQGNMLLQMLAYMFDPNNKEALQSGGLMAVFAVILGFKNPNELQGWMGEVSKSELKVGTALQDITQSDRQINHQALDSLYYEKPVIFERSGTRQEMLSEYPGLSNLLATIRDAEHIRTGDAVYNTAFGDKTVNFTSMTVDQVLQWQLDNNPPGLGTAAAGGYQIIRPTLLELKDEMGLKGNEIFDKNLQDEMAIVLLEGRGLFDGLTASNLAYNVSKEWASVPKDASGKSYYDKDGINSAQIDYGTIIAAINDLDQSSPITPTLTRK